MVRARYEELLRNHKAFVDGARSRAELADAAHADALLTHAKDAALLREKLRLLEQLRRSLTGDNALLEELERTLAQRDATIAALTARLLGLEVAVASLKQVAVGGGTAFVTCG